MAFNITVCLAETKGAGCFGEVKLALFFSVLQGVISVCVSFVGDLCNLHSDTTRLYDDPTLFMTT